MKHIPNKIFLNLGFKPEKGDDFNDLQEVTWCVDKVDDKDIEYQRKPIWHDLRKNPKDLQAESNSLHEPIPVNSSKKNMTVPFQDPSCSFLGRHYSIGRILFAASCSSRICRLYL